MTESDEWDQIVRNVQGPGPTHQLTVRPTPVQAATANLINTLTALGGLTWLIWLISWIAGMLG
jgi:hypothetical protein